MATIARELDLRREIADKCRSCGTCRSVCPVFAELGLEAAVARGKVALIRAVLDGELTLTDIFDEKIQLCLNCKTCWANCPNDVPVDHLILAARNALVEAGRLSFLKRLIFRQLLRRGRLLPPVGRLASLFQRVVLRGLPKDSAFRALLPVAGFDRYRVFPHFAPRSLIDSVPAVTPAATSRGDDSAVRRVGFFVGCATNLIYPESGRAVIDALARSGVEVVLPRDQGCCGTPVMNSGDFTTARELARTNIAAFAQAGVDAVVTACASCGLTLKSEYAEVLGLEDGLGIPVYDFAEFLTQRREPLSVPAASASRPTIRVAYHDPCHLVRGQGISREPREILKGLPWVEYVEMRDADRCCGGGGTFCLTHYDVARAIGGRKVEAIRDAGVDIVATECPSCVMQLRDMVEQAGLSVAVVALADVVAMGDGALDA